MDVSASPAGQAGVRSGNPPSGTAGRDPGRAGRLPSWRSLPLFWRTFLLIAALSFASLAAWLPSVRMFEREPRAQRIAQQVVSIVHLTRSALVYSDPDRRRGLLLDLADHEGVRVVPLEPGDQVQPLPDIAMAEMVTRDVRRLLGEDTRLAAKVDGVPGLWVSFSIDDDAYWVYINRDLLARGIGREWITWAVISSVLSLAVAAVLARVVTRPLGALSRAANELGRGQPPPPLPEERGPPEIRAVNRNFNRMVADLERLARDRSTLLAGVSHDLRTPLTRLRLELELAALPEPARDAMIGDLEQMDAVLHQFLDYARPAPARDAIPVDLAALTEEALQRSRLDHAAATVIARPPGGALHLAGNRTELGRAIDNLLANADRYGRDADGTLRLQVELRREAGEALLCIRDQGPGIAPGEVERLLRPFERGEVARSGAAGAGLGLAIVARIARHHGGRLELLAAEGGGLRAQLRLPLAPDRDPGAMPGA